MTNAPTPTHSPAAHSPAPATAGAASPLPKAAPATIPDDILETARKVLSDIDGELTMGRLYVVARALVAERQKATEAERERSKAYWLEWSAKRQKVTRDAWERDARAALAGDMRALRNRIDLIDAGPVEVVLSSAIRSNQEGKG